LRYLQKHGWTAIASILIKDSCGMKQKTVSGYLMRYPETWFRECLQAANVKFA